MGTKTAWDRFLDFGKGWGLIVAIVGAGVTIGVIFETRIFETPEQRHSIIKAYKESPSPEQKQRALILDSINKTKAIKSRKMRDSVFILIRQDQIEMKNGLKNQDSINILNADQLYQIKEKLKN